MIVIDGGGGRTRRVRRVKTLHLLRVGVLDWNQPEPTLKGKRRGRTFHFLSFNVSQTFIHSLWPATNTLSPTTNFCFWPCLFALAIRAATHILPVLLVLGSWRHVIASLLFQDQECLSTMKSPKSEEERMDGGQGISTIFYHIIPCGETT